MPFYLDWSFWAVIVAAIAIILSQLPPIHIIVRRAKIEMELYSRILVTHKVGNPNIQLHLILTNVGGRSVRIRSISLSLKRDGKEIGVLPAQNYLENPNDKTNVLLTSFELKSKDEWAHIVNFLNYFSRTDEKKYRNAEVLLKNDIQSKRILPDNKDRLVEADSKNVTALLEMFNEKFVWFPGDYELSVLAMTSDKKVNALKNYRFTLFESDSSELSKVKDDYKLGDGIYWNSENHPGVILQITGA